MLTDLFERAKSRVYSICFVSSTGSLVASGTAFWCQGFLVTNNHVFAGPENCRVEVRLESEIVVSLSALEFQSRLVTGSDEENHDYAILDFPELKNLSDFAFNFRDPTTTRVATHVALLGYPFGRQILSLHQGFISAKYQKGKKEYLQIDASVNKGNSGGPLVSADDFKVLGLVTRKENGLDSAFESLRNSLIQNIKILQAARQWGSVQMLGVDPLEALEISQNQMMQTLRQIERSANVGIGYAFSVAEIMKESCFAI